MIYFTSDKRAFGSPIEGYIATIDDEIWRHYADEIAGTDWDIVDEEFVKLTSIDDMINRENAAERIMELKRLLTETDYKAVKYAEGEYTVEEYEPTKTARAGWRAEINVLQDLQNK